ncbi:FixH family protein [Amycolatopsis cynarae]|uniref:FixH family protein n=1 Tax=Amycolatopsis cynarae TaxID=2995223 RepID=A0ABY7BAE8_9PSEU|nr:FixH family protein [Amycolatopsis sp. HUAS 11-8]WAL69325.1 FixH family protein [Amycolatopsis sp. HUAS 11-8]
MTRRRMFVLAPLVLAAAIVVWLCLPSADAGTVVQQAAGRIYQVRLSVEDPRVGVNALSLEVTPSSVEEVRVEPVMPQMGHALAPVPATVSGPGSYRAEATLPMSGQWELTLVLEGPLGTEQLVIPLLVKG